MTTLSALNAVWLGTQPYAPVYALQCELAAQRKNDAVGDTILLLEHRPTITMGRSTKLHHLLSSRELLSSRGIDLVETDRGGDVTLHGPGQLVAYPIVKLEGVRQDVRKYVNALTSAMQQLVAHYGISAGPAPGLVGLWTDLASPTTYTDFASATTPVKLGAIGVRISRWITMHGFALNLTTDLSLFSNIVPCGIAEYGVASIQSVTGLSPSVRDAADHAFPLLAQELGRNAGRVMVWDGPLENLAQTLAKA